MSIAMVHPWEIPEDFQFLKEYKTLHVTLKTFILQENRFKRVQIGPCWKACF
jgi:hypothetical protein